MPGGANRGLRGGGIRAYAWVREGVVLEAGGREKRAMDGASPRQDMDVRPREKRLPADRGRRPTEACFSDRLAWLREGQKESPAGFPAGLAAPGHFPKLRRRMRCLRTKR